MLSGDRTAEWSCSGFFSAYTAILVPLGPWNFFSVSEARVHCVCWYLGCALRPCRCFTATGFKSVFPTGGNSDSGRCCTHVLSLFPDTCLHIASLIENSVFSHKKALPRNRCRWMEKAPPGPANLPVLLEARWSFTSLFVTRPLRIWAFQLHTDE